MEFHTLTDGLPRMAEGDLAVLADDILRNGLICPILTFEGKIIDGRDRFAACELVGVKPDFQEATPEAMISVIMRKPTSTDQKAMIASRHLMTPEEAKAKQVARLKGSATVVGNADDGSIPKMSVRAARTKFNVDDRSIAEAKRLRDIAESNGNADVVFEVEVGRITLKELAVALDVEPITRKRKTKAATTSTSTSTEPPTQAEPSNSKDENPPTQEVTQPATTKKEEPQAEAKPFVSLGSPTPSSTFAEGMTAWLESAPLDELEQLVIKAQAEIARRKKAATKGDAAKLAREREVNQLIGGMISSTLG